MSSQVGFVGAGKKAVHVKVRFARVCTRSRDSASLDVSIILVWARYASGMMGSWKATKEISGTTVSDGT